MVAVYIDPAGDVRSANTDALIVPAGTTPREARLRSALLAAAADALQNSATAGTARRPARGSRVEGMPAVAVPTPISAAPSYARTVGEARRVLAVIDVEQLAEETAQQLAALAQGELR
ncbi:hypothetical protein [Dietzia sp. CQ4]|uniref:hypothetical protein n=1 Tax=Dietzia sp. (strain CQ4) TaxID=370437 RepID=UPI001F513F48|nr:hypothetical protein [Dietzia sp. CQ4]